MIAPQGFETMSDEVLLKKLMENYDADAASYVLDVLRGRIKPKNPLT